jgi:hypothetical protein
VRLVAQSVTKAARPASSPARNLVSKLAGAFQHKPIPKAAAAGSGTNDSNWEEF